MTVYPTCSTLSPQSFLHGLADQEIGVSLEQLKGYLLSKAFLGLLKLACLSLLLVSIASAMYGLNVPVKMLPPKMMALEVGRAFGKQLNPTSGALMKGLVPLLKREQAA